MDIPSFEEHLKPYIKSNVDLLRSTLKRGDVFVDVGSNTGLLTKMLLDFLGSDYLKEAILFEPIPPFAEECRAKFKDYSNVRVEQIALSDSEEDKRMLVSKINLGYSKIYKEGMDIHPHHEFTVKSRTFDNWALDSNINHVDFIKIDAEGHDTNVIEGCFEFLTKAAKKPYILFECGWYKEEEEAFIQKMKEKFNYNHENLTEDNRLSGDILLIP